MSFPGTFKMYTSQNGGGGGGGGGGGVGSFLSACRIYLSSSQSPAGNLNPIPFDASDLDTDGYADLANNRIVIPTGFAGWFDVTLRVGVAPQAAISGGVGQVFFKTVAHGNRDYEDKSWRELNDLVAQEAEYRIVGAFHFADGDALYAEWQDATTGGSGFYVFGGLIGSGGVAPPAPPETYLQIERRTGGSTGLQRTTHASESVTAATNTTLTPTLTATVTGEYDVNVSLNIQATLIPNGSFARIVVNVAFLVNGSASLYFTTAALATDINSGVPQSPVFGANLAGILSLTSGDVVAVRVNPHYLQPEVSNLTNFTVTTNTLVIAPR